MPSWETDDDDRAACPVVSQSRRGGTGVNDRPADRLRRWHCCIKRSARSVSTRAPKSPAACCGMTVLCRSSPTPEVCVAQLCHPSRAPSLLMQQSHCPSGRPSGRAGGWPAWRWPTSCSTLSKPSGDGSTATGSARSSALAPNSSTENYKKGTTTNGGLKARRLRQLLAVINDLPYLSLRGSASAGTARCKELPNQIMACSWQIRTPPSPLARRDTVALPTAGHDHDDDIVQLALAILDEELRSWTRHRGHASQAEGVLEPHEQSGDAS
jgi:hypothetical protein